MQAQRLEFISLRVDIKPHDPPAKTAEEYSASASVVAFSTSSPHFPLPPCRHVPMLNFHNFNQLRELYQGLATRAVCSGNQSIEKASRPFQLAASTD